MNPPDPRTTYHARLHQERAESARLGRRDDLLVNLRGATFLIGLVLAGLTFWWPPAHGLRSAFLLAPFAAFAMLVFLHDRSLRARARVKATINFYERGLARLDHRWIGNGNPGDGFLDPEHPYAQDLDLFGRGSLFELICTAQTRAGEQTLATWLLRPADAQALGNRHAAVSELRDRLGLREELAVMTRRVGEVVQPEDLARWGTAPLKLYGRTIRVVAAVLAALNAISLVAWLAGWIGPVLFAVALLLTTLFRLQFGGRLRAVSRALRGHDYELAVVGQVTERFLRERFDGEYLRALQERLTSRGQSAPEQIRHFERLVRLLEQGRNQFFLPIALLLHWDVQVLAAIEGWRARVGDRVGPWLDAIGEAEALLAIASYAYEHPEDPLPELCADPSEALFDAEQLGHPLLSEAEFVRNDLRLGSTLRVLIVSGSNMSGKSTLLRTVGVNAVLAQAGAPVRARRLRVAALAIGASLRPQDTLLGGRSRFYAEIQRLKHIVDLSASPGRPLLFLFDEIMSGTNSHDRLIGATALVRALVERGAIGLVTTHDLALAGIVTALGERAGNVHFADEIAAGQLVFDFRIRPGVVQQSNAIALMRAVGLDLDFH